MPLAAAGQIAPERPPADRTAPSFKYEAYALAGYTSLNQVNQSRYGLIGGKFGVTRDCGRHFGVTAMGDYYKPPAGTRQPRRSVSVRRAGGPGVSRQPLRQLRRHDSRHARRGTYGRRRHDAQHLSFAGGFGGGMLYNLSQHLALRASGDRIALRSP